MNRAEAIQRRCICRHYETTHIIEGSESICTHTGCKCQNFFLWEVTFYDPTETMHTTSDVAKFVRDNQGLFLPEDVEMKDKPCRAFYHGLSGQYCNAECGLDSLVTYRTNSWKDWTVAIFPKTYRET